MEKAKTSNRGLTSFQLKIIGIAAMVCDHVGVVFFPEFTILRIIGRISFPVFAFLLVEGYFHTRSIPRYMGRLFLMALISEIPYDLAMYGRVVDLRRQNVFFTLFLGILMLYLFETRTNGITKVISLILVLLASEALLCDYNSSGLLMILGFYVYYERPWMRGITNAYVNMQAMGGIQSYGALALIPIGFYNGMQGSAKGQKMFYACYPGLLLILLAAKIIF